MKNISVWTVILQAVILHTFSKGLNFHVITHYDGFLKFTCCKDSNATSTDMMEIQTKMWETLAYTDFHRPPWHTDKYRSHRLTFTTTVLCGTLTVSDFHAGHLTLRCKFKDNVLSQSITACSSPTENDDYRGLSLHVITHYEGFLEFTCCKDSNVTSTDMMEIQTKMWETLAYTDFHRPPWHKDKYRSHRLTFTTTVLCGTLTVSDFHAGHLTLRCKFKDNVLSQSIMACSLSSSTENDKFQGSVMPRTTTKASTSNEKHKLTKDKNQSNINGCTSQKTTTVTSGNVIGTLTIVVLVIVEFDLLK